MSSFLAVFRHRFVIILVGYSAPKNSFQALTACFSKHRNLFCILALVCM